MHALDDIGNGLSWLQSFFHIMHILSLLDYNLSFVKTAANLQTADIRLFEALLRRFHW